MDRQQHWQKVYATKNQNEVSWYQPVPQQSLDFIRSFTLDKNAAIIDIGGGDSLLVDSLLDQGFSDITVLDISDAAIEKAKARLGNKASRVTWIVSDILDFVPDKKYDLWHDRATFHFLTTEDEINRYITVANKSLKPGAILLLATFSTEGPEKCSGLPVKRYNENILSETLHSSFEKIKCITTNHVTPFNTIQNFIFCSFKKSKYKYGYS